MDNEQIAIRLEDVSKTFGRRKKAVRAVRNLTLNVEVGQVFGFLGPNGAGKTTTIRMLMDLIRPSAGQLQIYGRSPQRDHAVLQRVGALVETATFYGFLTGRRNLELLAYTGGWQEPARIQACLERVGMAGRADRKVSGYSTGMKQRLGIAAALLGDPDLLVLDEPTNGLDPAGIKEIRTLIRRLVDDQGKTVFLSSHLLSEIEQVCDRVAIIANGQLIQEGAVADLLASHSQVLIEASPLDTVMQLLQAEWTPMPDGTSVRVEATRAQVPAIISLLTAHDVAVYQVTVQRQSLEDFFMSVTGEGDVE